MNNVIGFDTESFYNDECSVKSLASAAYARHPRCDVYMISVADATEAWAGHPRDFNFDSLNGKHLVSHNAYHDQEIVEAKIEQGIFPRIRPAQWDCTANMSAYLCNRRSLAEASEFLLGEHVSKVARDSAKGKTWEEIVAEGKGDEMIAYARGDAIKCRRLFVEHGHKWPEWERELSRLTIEQGRRGVHIHEDRLRQGILLLQSVVLKATDMLPWVKAGRAPASPHGVAEACRAAGIPPPPVKAHDADAAADWEEQYSAQHPWVKALKDLRKAKKTLATLETIARRLRNGVLPFQVKYFGAHTGRWAGDAGINMQNLNRSPLFVRNGQFVDDKGELEALTKLFEKNPDDPQLNCIDVRGLFLPPPGMLIGATDLGQIEPRVLNWLVGNYEFLGRVAAGFPIYEAHARDSMGWTGGELKSENKKLYALAKARVLGLGFGCGWEKFITVAKTMAGLDITEDDQKAALAMSVDGKVYTVDDRGEPCEPFVLCEKDFKGNYQYSTTDEGDRVEQKIVLQRIPVYGANSKQIVQSFRDSNPLIVGLWASLHSALERAAERGEDLVLELPSGRKLTYRKCRVEKRLAKDKETGKEYHKRVITAEADGLRRVYYGGLLAENITQACARDVFAQNMLRIRRAGIWPMWSVHDESVNAVRNAEEGKLAQQLMASVPEWLPGCPIESSLELSDRYKK